MSYGGDHRGPAVNILSWTLTGVAGIVLGMRIFSRLTQRTFGRDDAIIIFSFVVIVTYVSSLSAAVAAGFGNHLPDIPPNNRPLALYRQTISSCLAVLTFAFPKLAIISLLQRLLKINLITAVIFWVLGGSLVVSSLILAIFWFVQCTPPAHQWDPQRVPGTCWDPVVVLDMSYFVGIYSGVLDVVFALYPPFVIWRLHMPKSKKIFISACLGGGLIAAIAAFYKISFVSELSQEAKTDPTWAPVPLLIWTAIEADLLIITASLPTIGPSLRFVSQRYKQYTSSGKPDSSTYPSKYYHGYRRTTRQSRSVFGSRSHDRSEQGVPLVDVDIERSTADAFPSRPDRTRPPPHTIWKDTTVEVSHDRTFRGD